MAGWIEYDSNNSGGSWWLSDKNWKALEDAGWHVNWLLVTASAYNGSPYVSTGSGRRYGDTWEKVVEPYVVGANRWEKKDDEKIVATATNYDEAVALRKKYGDYMGALATSAAKQGESAVQLVSEFEEVTGQSASDEGCNCCGPPHSFEWHDDNGTSSYGSVQVTETKLVWS